MGELEYGYEGHMCLDEGQEKCGEELDMQRMGKM